MHAASEALGSNRLRGFSPVLLMKVSAGTLFPAATRSARILIASSRRLWVSSTACTYSGWICWGEREEHRRVVSGGLKFSSQRERNSGVQTLRSNAHTWGDADCFVVDKSLERRVHTPFASCSWLAGPPKHKAKPFLSRCKGWLLSYLPPILSGDRLPGREQAELLVLVLTTYCGIKAKRQHPPRSSMQSLVTPQREPFQNPATPFSGSCRQHLCNAALLETGTLLAVHSSSCHHWSRGGRFFFVSFMVLQRSTFLDAKQTHREGHGLFFCVVYG